jgi:hypothetical protein
MIRDFVHVYNPVIFVQQIIPKWVGTSVDFLEDELAERIERGQRVGVRARDRFVSNIRR